MNARTEALLTQVFQRAAEALLVVDEAGRIILANEQSERLFERDVHGLHVDLLVPHRLRDEHAAQRRAYWSDPDLRPMGHGRILNALTASGIEVPAEISLSPFELDGRRLVCVSIRDVSELQRGRDALARIDQAQAIAGFGRLALLARELEPVFDEACRLAVAYLHCRAAALVQCNLGPDNRGRVVAFHATSAGEETTLGKLMLACALSQPEALGATAQPADAPPPGRADPDVDGEHRSPTPAPHVASNLTCCLVPGDLRGAWYLVVATSPKGSDSRAGAASSAPLARGSAEASFLQVLSNSLGAVLHRRSSEEQLFQSQRLEALGQLTGGVAHDFNNLLTVISGNLEMLQERSEDKVALRMVEAARRAAGRGAELTNKLLAFARRQRLQPRAVNVAELFGSLADILRRTLGSNIEVVTSQDEDLPTLAADPALLDTALLNLALNARDAMADGGRISIEARAVTIDPSHPLAAEVAVGRYVRISVVDDGSGMSPDVLERAFEPFFTTKDVGRGSGLGLSLVYGFAKQSGGHASVESSSNAGTAVHVLLPVAADALASRPIPRALPLRGGNETVLVVEDDDEVRAIAVDLVTRLGYQVIEAADAEQGLRHLGSRDDIAVLFSDVVLRGGMNGAVLASKAVALRPELRVLLTSGDVRNEAGSATPATMRFALLPKPYNTESIARELRAVLDAPAQQAG